jgi:uncharacterized protein (TIGR02646 family)
LAYCMSRVNDDPNLARIEHFLPSGLYPDQQLAWSNLLICCNGGEGGPSDQSHCDVRKGDQLITYNPCDPNLDITALLRYLGNGELRSSDDAMEIQIKVLGLNQRQLVLYRQQTIVGLIAVLGNKRKQWSISQLTRHLRIISTCNAGGKLRPLVGVEQYYLQRKLNKMQS